MTFFFAKKKKKSSLKPKNADGETKKSSKKSTKIADNPEDASQEGAEPEVPNEVEKAITRPPSVDCAEPEATPGSVPSSRKNSRNIETPPPTPTTVKERSNSTAEKSAMDVINEIFNPPLLEFDPKKPYNVPEAVKAGDVEALQDLDERKLIELKEVGLKMFC